MNEAILNRDECEALSLFVNNLIQDVPDDQISDSLRSAAAKIEAVVTNGE